MKNTKKWIIAGALTVGMGTGAALFTPMGMSASNNVVLASVDWVTTQLNPMKSKMTELEAKINAQQLEINSLKAQIGKPANPPATPPAEGTLPPELYAAKSSVKVYSGASTNYRVVATKSLGFSFKVIDSFKASTGIWYRVELSATVKGWVLYSDVTTTKPVAAVPTKVVTVADAYLRKGASTGYPVIYTAKSGVTLKYLSSFTNTKGETWYNVQTSTGLKGWMFAALGEVK